MVYLLFAILSMLHLAAAESVTITQAPAYASQRPCATRCFGYDGHWLASAVGCEWSNPQNECVCRPDLQNNADGYLSSCVSRGCSANTLDINTAASIYSAYCTAAGFLRSTPTTMTSGTDDFPSVVTVTVTATVKVSSARKRVTSPLQGLAVGLASLWRMGRG